MTGHIPALIRSNRCRLHALMDTDPGRLEEVQDRFPSAQIFSEIEAFFRTPGLDAVIVATPPDSHFRLCMQAIQRGLPVLVEKPLCRTADECSEIQHAAASAGVRVAVGHEKRFHPTMRRLRQLLQDGWIGEPFYCGVHWASSAKEPPSKTSSS